MKSLYRQYIKLQKEIDALVEIESRKVMLNHALAFQDIDRELAAIYKEYADKEGQINFNEFKKYNRTKKLDSMMSKIIRRVYKDNAQVTMVLLRDIIKDSYKHSIEIVNKNSKWNLVGIQKEFDITRTLNKNVKGYNWTERMGRNRNETISRIQKSVKQSLRDGDTYNTAAKKLSDELGISMNKSLTIARTESHRCLSESKQQSFEDMKKQGASIKKRWISSQDERVRSAHSDLDGVTIDVEDEFESSLGGKGKSPGNMGTPQDNINCRCIIVLEVD